MSPSSHRDGATISLLFEGRKLTAVPGETVAATLIAHGFLRHGESSKGEPRGLYCGIGVCHDCLVSIDGRASQRACLSRVADGMSVRPQSSARFAAALGACDLAPLPPAEHSPRAIDILVIGAGPSGLTAARAARARGADVLMLDERPMPGGQYFKQPADGDPTDGQARRGAALIAEVGAAGVGIRTETLVWGAARRANGGLEICAYAEGIVLVFHPRILIIATGADERPVVVPGWTLPGVMTTGAAQTLQRSYGVAPGRRLVLAGNGPLNFQVAAELLRSADEVTVVEAATAPWRSPAAGLAAVALDPRLAVQGLGAIARLVRGHGRIFWRHRLIAVEGAGRVERALIAPIEDGGAVNHARRIAVPADAVLTGDGFRPARDLALLLGCRTEGSGIARDDDGATSLPDIFVVGEAGGFGGAEIARLQGERAGLAAAARLGLGKAAQPDTRLATQRRFQRALWRLFAAPAPGLPLAAPETVLCRCEGLTLGALQDAIARHDLRDAASVKRLTRAGMGRCQGRYCAANLSALLQNGHEDGFAPQVPLRPVPLAALAVEKPEWAGHRRSLLPPQPLGRDDPLPVAEVATLVIGAGVVGLSTALFLARSGEPVVVLDSRSPNAGASGGNAGSLHGQLLSFDHGAKAAQGGGAALRALGLQRESIALWHLLAAELGADMEIKLSGGVMVAETEADLAFLEAKVAAERAHGIDCEVIGPARLRQLEPHLDPRFLGASFCPGEGKINPLLASEAVRMAATASGATIFHHAPVRSIAREAGGFIVKTSRGVVRAGRVVNAAGAFAGEIGAMLGVQVPVFGAPLQMVVTEAAEPLLSGLVAHASRHLTLKQAANGTVLIGGGWTAGLDPVQGHPRPVRASLEGNLWIAQHVLPALRRLHVVRSWAAMNIDIDGAPILGEDPAMPGLFHAVTSNGYTLGPLMGRVTADLIRHGHADRDLDRFSIARFRSTSGSRNP